MQSNLFNEKEHHDHQLKKNISLKNHPSHGYNFHGLPQRQHELQKKNQENTRKAFDHPFHGKLMALSSFKHQKLPTSPFFVSSLLWSLKTKKSLFMSSFTFLFDSPEYQPKRRQVSHIFFPYKQSLLLFSLFYCSICQPRLHCFQWIFIAKFERLLRLAVDGFSVGSKSKPRVMGWAARSCRIWGP